MKKLQLRGDLQNLLWAEYMWTEYTLLTRDSEGHHCPKGGNKEFMQLETITGKMTTLEVGGK